MGKIASPSYSCMGCSPTLFKVDYAYFMSQGLSESHFSRDAYVLLFHITFNAYKNIYLNFSKLAGNHRRLLYNMFSIRNSNFIET